MKQWTKLPFVATEDTIFTILETWPPKWHAPDLEELEKVVAQKKKDDAKLRITQLTEKRRKEKATDEVGEVQKAAQKSVEQKKSAKATTTAQEVEEATTEAEETSSGQEVEEIETTEGSVDPGAASTQLKCQRIVQRSGPWKKVKGSKLAIDLITLTEGDLHDIGETVRDVTSDTLQ